VNLYEFEGKALLRRAGIPTPRGMFATDVDKARAAGEAIGYPCVVKSQVLIGGRGKAGGIAVVENAAQLETEAARIRELVIRGESPIGLLVEERVPAGREIYASVAFDTSVGSPVLLFSPFGGMEVEANKEHLLRIPVGVDELGNMTPEWVTARLEAGLAKEYAGELGKPLLAKIGALLADLLRAALQHDLELIEINPLIVTAAGLVAADAKVTVDDDAMFRQQDLVLVERPPLGELEARAKAASLNFVDLDGEICLMANGAGLNMSLLDAVGRFGSSPANFLDTGGGASTAKAYEAVRILQDRGMHDPKVRARLLMLSLAITRVREAAQGIIQAVKEHPEDPVSTIAVVHGTGAEEGVQLLEEAGIRVAPDIKTAVELALALQRRR
jgi:succinyl-CoA synthetase beta subunit